MKAYKKTWKEDIQFDRHPKIWNYKRKSVKDHLDDFRTIRHAVIHQDGQFNGRPIPLTAEYIKYAFTLIEWFQTL